MKSLAFSLFVALLFASCNKSDTPGNTTTTETKLGQVYFYTGTFNCVDVETMTTTWKTSNVFSFSSTTPAFDNGIVYTCNVYGATALKIATGEKLWSTPYSSTNYANNTYTYTSSPIIKDSFLYCTGFTGSNGNPAVYCINKNTGAIKWFAVLANAGIRHISRVPSPVLSGNNLVIAGEGWDAINKFLCYDRFSGALLWSKDLQAMSITPSMYLVSDAANVYFNDPKRPNVHCFDAATGNKKWSLTLPEILQADERMSMFGNYLLGSSGLALYLIDKNAGTLSKTISTPDYLNSVRVDNSKIYGAESYGDFAKFDLNGAKEWTYKTNLTTLYDSMLAAQVVPFAYPSELVTAEDHVLQAHNLYSNVNGKCAVRGFFILDKSTGKLLKQTNDCTVQIPYGQYVYVVDGKAYYPNQGGNY